MDTNMRQHTRDLEIYQENFTAVMNKLSNEIDKLGSHAARSFSEALADNSNELNRKMTESMEESFKGIINLLEQFRENQIHFAKTISSLPDQVLTYNEAAASKIDRMLTAFKDKTGQ
jgi:hypothetical protein